MTLPGTHLSTLPEGPEADIIIAFYDLLKADPVIGEQAVDGSGKLIGFQPWLLVESPTREALLNFANWTAVVQPWAVNIVDYPGHHETLRPQAMVALYVPTEESSESSDLLCWRLLNQIRKISHALVLRDRDTHDAITFATTDVKAPVVAILPNQGTRVFCYIVEFQTEIDQRDGSFI